MMNMKSKTVSLDEYIAEYLRYLGIAKTARLPIDPTLVSAVDAGQIESYANAQVTDEIDKAIEIIS